MTTNGGDVVVFDLRMTHSGMLPTFPEKILRKINRLLSLVKKKSSFGRHVKSLIWSARQIRDRESIFFVFGSDNDITETFAANIVKAQSSAPEHKAKISPQLSKNLQKKGIRICRSINPFC